MKNLIFCLVLMCGAVAHADVNIMTVTDEDRHTKKEDFYHTFEYHILPLGRGNSAAKCQATRIGLPRRPTVWNAARRAGAVFKWIY